MQAAQVKELVGKLDAVRRQAHACHKLARSLGREDAERLNAHFTAGLATIAQVRFSNSAGWQGNLRERHVDAGLDRLDEMAAVLAEHVPGAASRLRDAVAAARAVVHPPEPEVPVQRTPRLPTLRLRTSGT